MTVTRCNVRSGRVRLRDGSHVHIVELAQLDWSEDWAAPRLQIRPACRPKAWISPRTRPQLVPDGDITCRACSAIQKARDLGATYLGEQYTYYARRDADGFIKIGVSVNPGLRCFNLGLNLLAVELSVSTASEGARHTLFADLRRDGEFFEPSDDLAAHVESLARTQGDTMSSHGHELMRAKRTQFGPGWAKDVDDYILKGHARAAWRCGVAS